MGGFVGHPKSPILDSFTCSPLNSKGAFRRGENIFLQVLCILSELMSRLPNREPTAHRAPAS